MNTKDIQGLKTRNEIDAKRAELQATKDALQELERQGVTADIDVEERRLTRLAAVRSVLKAQEGQLAELVRQEREATRQLDEKRIAALSAELSRAVAEAAEDVVRVLDSLNGMIPLETELRKLGGSVSSPRQAMAGSLRQAAIVSGLYQSIVQSTDGAAVVRRRK